MSRHKVMKITITICITILAATPCQCQYDGHNPGYDASSPPYYEAPQPVYIPPQDSYSAASSEFASYTDPNLGYEQPINSPYKAPSSFNKFVDSGTFQTSFSDQDRIQNIRPPRDGHLEECYCVPQGQCPTNKILGNTVKDYSNLINPRNKNSNAGITSVGRTLVESEESSEDHKSEKIIDAVLKTDVFGRARSLTSVIEAIDDNEEDKYIKKTLSRNKRESIFDDKKKTTINEEVKAEKEGSANELEPQGRKQEIDNSDFVNVAVQDKSISDDIFDGISRLVGTSTSTGQLQPTIGVSFGLPQPYPGYAGYPQPPAGAGNPYYTAQQGLQVGPVNLNPLFSLQAGTTDSGDLAVKPLVNLHLTPNGCGILGCDKNYDDYADVSKTVIDAITNPFGIFSKDHAAKHSISSDYTAPQPSYSSSSSYGVPGTSYNSPSTGAPTHSYGAPSQSYGAPSQSYGARTQSYGAPSQSYGAPTQSYGAPSQSYVASRPSYDLPKPSYHPPNQSSNTQVLNQPSPKYNSIPNTDQVHYNHNQDSPSPQYTGEDIQTYDYFSDNSNHVKRNTEPTSGSPQKSSSSAIGFKFPKERNARKVTITEDKKEKGELASKDFIFKSPESDQQNIVYFDRSRRSHDGIGQTHLQTSLHHDLNSQYDPNIQIESFQNDAHQLTDKRSIGNEDPTGYRSPTCGGAGSGFVCCSVVSDLSGVAGPGPDTVRHTRQPQEGNQVAAGQFSRQGQCGRRNAHGVTGRINNPAQTFNEGDTEFGEYPWQVALLKKEKFDNVYVCGGSLIDSSHLLTAAHCIKQFRPEDIRVRLGEWDVNNDSEFYPNIEFDVLSITVHPEFYSGNLFNDIAIIKLDGFVDFPRNPHISPVCLPDTFQDFAGERCYVTGWGKDAFGGGGAYQQVLKEVDVPVLLDFDCERKLKKTRLGLDFVLHPSFVCAGGEEGKDSCKGDGGGPLVCQVEDSWQLAGIVSWGVGCGEKDIPGVYVKVSHFNQWIKEMMITT